MSQFPDALADTPRRSQAFEHVVPNELTRLRVRLSSASLHVSALSRASHLVLTVADARLRTDLMPDLPRTTFAVEVEGVKVGMVDSEADVVHGDERAARETAWEYWKVRLAHHFCAVRWMLTDSVALPQSKGFAQILHVHSASITARQGNGLVLPDVEVRPRRLPRAARG